MLCAWQHSGRHGMRGRERGTGSRVEKAPISALGSMILKNNGRGGRELARPAKKGLH